MPRNPKATGMIKELDRMLDSFVNTTRYIHEPFNRGRAEMFIMQHRLNSRYRNSVLKLKVATNCPDWDTRLGILGAAAEELIADHEFGGGLPHWLILENVGVDIGMSRKRIRAAKPLKTTQLAWNAWGGVMTGAHWLEGLLGNVISERTNVPGYGKGQIRRTGWLGYEFVKWKGVFDLTDEQLDFFRFHGEADQVHSDLGWNTLGKQAKRLGMEDRLLEVARQNLDIWELYLNGIGDAGDELEASTRKRRAKTQKGKAPSKPRTRRKKH